MQIKYNTRQEQLRREMKRIITLAVLGLTVFSSILMSTDSASATINPDIQLVNQSVGIAVSPLHSERAKLNPGETITGRFRVRQTGQETNEIYVHAGPLSLKKDTPKYELDYETVTPRTAVAQWLTINSVEGCTISRVEDNKTYFWMRSKEECYVNYTLKVPNDALNGSQSAAIFTQSVPDDSSIEGVGLASSYRFAYQLYTDINGPGAYAEGKILSNNIPWIILSFDQPKPLEVTSKVENTGTLDFGIKYDVKMNNWFGGEEVYQRTWESLAFAENDANGSTAWEQAPTLGLYKVTQNINILDENPDNQTSSSRTQMVLLIPIWLLIIIIIVILLLLWALYTKIKERKDGKK